MWAMPADQFCRFAERLAAYPGVMQARVIAQEQETEKTPKPFNPADPAFAGIVEYTKTPQRR